jgi:hypothetical protein
LSLLAAQLGTWPQPDNPGVGRGWKVLGGNLSGYKSLRVGSGKDAGQDDVAGLEAELRGDLRPSGVLIRPQDPAISPDVPSAEQPDGALLTGAPTLSVVPKSRAQRDDLAQLTHGGGGSVSSDVCLAIKDRRIVAIKVQPVARRQGGFHNVPIAATLDALTQLEQGAEVFGHELRIRFSGNLKDDG